MEKSFEFRVSSFELMIDGFEFRVSSFELTSTARVAEDSRCPNSQSPARNSQLATRDSQLYLRMHIAGHRLDEESAVDVAHARAVHADRELRDYARRARTAKAERRRGREGYGATSGCVEQHGAGDGIVHRCGTDHRCGTGVIVADANPIGGDHDKNRLLG